MRTISIFLITILIISCFAHKKKNPLFEVPSESTETKSVLDIKQFLECAKSVKDFTNYEDFVKILERKKGYQKQLDYIKRVVPHNKEATLCKKSARRTVPKYLDVEQFAL